MAEAGRQTPQGFGWTTRKAGATGWLVKPVASAELVRVIKQVLPGA